MCIKCWKQIFPTVNWMVDEHGWILLCLQCVYILYSLFAWKESKLKISVVFVYMQVLYHLV